MKLKRLELENFRPFYGTQYLDFSESEKRNVTLVHAQNGQGKTTLLNALLWAFHGKFTGNFREPDLIVNKEAVREGLNSCKVEVHFEHDGREYRIARKHVESSATSIVLVSMVDDNGVIKPHPQQDAFIEQVFPADMADYFFFDGEYAENFANTTQDSDVHDAIKRILGCTAADHGLSDLEALEKRVHRQIKENTSNVEVRQLEDRREQLQEQIENAVGSIAQIKKDRAIVNRVLREINDRLAEIAASALIEKQRERAQKNLVVARERRRSLQQKLCRWVGEGALPLVGSRVAKECESVYEEMRKTAEIPAPYNEQFVKALISREKCICGRPLEPGSSEMSSVSSLLSTAAESETLRRLVRVTAYSQGQKRRHEASIREYRDIGVQLSQSMDDIVKFDQEVKELKKQLGESPVDEVAERERARDVKIRELKQLTDTEVTLSRGIEDARDDIRRIDSDLAKIRKTDKILNRLSRRLEFLKTAHGRLRSQLDSLQETALKTISRNTNELLKEILRKPYRVEVAKDYSLTLLDENSQRVPASSGESQLLSLSFLASLIRFCADRQRDQSTLLTPGTVAPFVLDSPFGQLDPVYKVGAARFLPKFADQVVLLLSASQGDQDVLRVLRPAIGSECALVQHNSIRRPAGDEKVEQIQVDGEKVVVTYWESPPTRTEIANVRYYSEA